MESPVKTTPGPKPEPKIEQRLSELARGVTGSANGAVRVELLTGQASNRLYYRLKVTGKDPLIAMVMPLDAKRSEEASNGAPPTELPFLNIQRYLALSGVPVPEVHKVALDEGILILEDLGDRTLEAALQHTPASELYGRAIDVLADLRVRAEQHPDSACIAFGRAFDRTLYRWELEHYVEYGLTARTGTPPSDAENQVLARSFDAIADALATLPRCFTHRDYQSRNLMIAPRGLVVIDFQDALLGPRQYDLVALLRDSYVELPDALVDELLARYIDRVQTQTKERIDPEGFRKAFDLLTVQRKLKDGGRFEFIARVKGNPSFLPHVPMSFGYVARALERLPAHAELLGILRARHPELS